MIFVENNEQHLNDSDLKGTIVVVEESSSALTEWETLIGCSKMYRQYLGMYTVSR